MKRFLGKFMVALCSIPAIPIIFAGVMLLAFYAPGCVVAKLVGWLLEDEENAEIEMAISFMGTTIAYGLLLWWLVGIWIARA